MKQKNFKGYKIKNKQFYLKKIIKNYLRKKFTIWINYKNKKIYKINK